MQQTSLRIAMWSGPRNISTALLRSWGNRPDTYVCDEPLYAHYLKKTNSPHPGADEIIAHQENDWHKVTQWLTGPIPEGKTIFYQKHMAHHLLPEIERNWLVLLTNCFLIREPHEMLTSLLKILPNPTLSDTGLPQQVEIFDRLRQQTGETPAVLDSRDILQNPRQQLQTLCDKLQIDFTEEMLSWPPGPRPTDGVWAKHWYGAVEKSTSFQPYKPKNESVPPQFKELCEECLQLYNHLHQHRLRP